MLKLQRSLDIRKWGIFPWMTFFSMSFLPECSFNVKCWRVWSIQSGPQHTGPQHTERQSLHLSLVFEWLLTDGPSPVEILEISWRSAPSEPGIPVGGHKSRRCWSTFFGEFPRAGEQVGVDSQGCGQGTHGGPQKPDALRLQPRDACWVPDVCAPQEQALD